MQSLLKIYKLAYQKKYIFYAILAIVFLLIEVGISLFVPYLSKQIIDEAIPSGDLSEVIRIGAIVVGIALGSVIAMAINNVTAQYISVNIATEIGMNLFEKIQKLSLANVDKITTGRLLTIVSNDTTQIQNILRMSFRVILRAPLTLIGAIVMAYITNPNVFVVVLILVPILLVSLILIFRRATPLFRALQHKIDNLNTKLEETVSGAREIKAFVTEQYEMEKYHEVSDDYNKAIISANKILALLSPVIMLISNFAIAIIIFIGAKLLNEGNNIIVGTIMTYIAYIMQIIGSLMILTNISVMLSRAIISGERVSNVLSMEIDIKNDPDAIDIDIKGDIEFNNVDFAYENGSEENGGITLRNINFKINAGEMIGVIGSTGSGKTSLVQLIPRMYDVTSGKVLIDGVDVRHIKLDNLRKQISFVTQEAIIFEGTIAENIRQGKDDATLEEMEEAAKLAAAKEFIDASEDKFNTLVTQKGTSLSGGQRQRLQLTRALVRKPKILILDDSTSAVDANTEAIIKENLRTIKRTTKIIVAQKISSIIDCDKIICLSNNGTIDGFGNHEELLKTSNVYKEIYQSQFGGDLDE
ncbi:MAG TPA: ABC transporter ATP-binding protein [Acholeplasmataceae bacterium]|nr:ABC transporter ATP-binding protein [Acholeplasmataceae bacterium]